MRQNHTLAQLRQGKPTIGLWLQTHSSNVARLIAVQGLFDWLVVDLEHSPLDVHTASTMLGAIADISGGACTPLARIAHNTMFHVKQALDAGAQGVIVPMVNTASEAADAVRFARFPPMGERGVGGLLPQLSFGIADRNEYVQNANAEILVGVQIETQEAVANVEAILDTPGIDLAFVGPYDLHLSLGLTPAPWSDHPTFQAAVQKVMAACQQRKMPCGVLTSSADGATARLKDGFTFVGLGTDIAYLLGALRDACDQIRPSLTE